MTKDKKDLAVLKGLMLQNVISQKREYSDDWNDWNEHND
jgi:hypothetical protein